MIERMHRLKNLYCETYRDYMCHKNLAFAKWICMPVQNNTVGDELLCNDVDMEHSKHCFKEVSTLENTRLKETKKLLGPHGKNEHQNFPFKDFVLKRKALLIFFLLKMTFVLLRT